MTTREPIAERDYVPDAATALTIGLAILTAYYGKEFIERFHPYRVAALKLGPAGEDWAVMGTSDAQREAAAEQERLGPDFFVKVSGGGAPEVVISKKDARAVQICLGR